MQWNAGGLPVSDRNKLQSGKGCRAFCGASKKQATTPSLEAAEGQLARGKQRANRVPKTRAVLPLLFESELFQSLCRN